MKLLNTPWLSRAHWPHAVSVRPYGSGSFQRLLAGHDSLVQSSSRDGLAHPPIRFCRSRLEHRFAVLHASTRCLHDRGKSGLYASLFYLPAALEISRFFLGPLPGLEQIAACSGLIAAWIGATGFCFRSSWASIKVNLDQTPTGPTRASARSQYDTQEKR